MTALAPSAATMNIGNRLWIISDEMSASMLTKPSIQIPGGMRRSEVDAVVGVARAVVESFEDFIELRPASPGRFAASRHLP